jgi:2-polyprenyl-3-methyl-5-hydroxy-6-metoxy-1,4-benzoquinol methylase
MSNFRPTDDSPWFVTIQELRRQCLAVALCSGKTLLDVGCGRGTLKDVVGPLMTYTGVDMELDNDVPCQPGQPFVQGDVFDYMEGQAASSTTWDNVVALEVIEHVDPRRQREFLASMWAVTARRMIFTTVSPHVRHWYPHTDLMVGAHNNPSHSRELDEHLVRRYIHETLTGYKQVMVLRNWLRSNDETVWDFDGGPCHGYLIMVEKAGFGS